MTISSGAIGQPTSAYVWVWRPGETEPVVAGRVRKEGTTHTFTYGRSYLNSDNAMPLYLPELPARAGTQRPDPNWEAHGCILDSAPDYWGRRVILANHVARLDRNSDTDDLSLMTYLLESGSDRIGALDFQQSADEYVPRVRDHTAPLEGLLTAADDIDAGRPVPPALEAAMVHGTSIGGARPKALIDDDGRPLIAKFSRATDTYPVVKAEAIAMELASQAGLNVAASKPIHVGQRDVLLVERFDRVGRDERRMMVSALTMLHRLAFGDRRATYPELADLVRQRFLDPDATLQELFARIVFNVIVGNTDDHAKNHAAFWDGRTLELTPGYDISPQPRSGNEVNQAMAITRLGDARSRLEVCVSAAEVYHLTNTAAQEIVEQLVAVVETGFDAAAERAGATELEISQLRGRSILNPSIFYTD